MSRKPVFVGGLAGQPSMNGHDPTFDAGPGTFFATLMGVDLHLMKSIFRFRNLLPFPLGPNDWSDLMAAPYVVAFQTTYNGLVILCGDPIARVFGYATAPYFVWQSPHGNDAKAYVVIPPAGDKWYNVKVNQVAAAAFLQKFLDSRLWLDF